MVYEYDRDLAAKLTAEREKHGNNRRFYKSRAWRDLRQQVLDEFHGASFDELRESPARYVPAECVHHDRDVEHYPGWALSEYWTDNRGRTHRNLFPLSARAHNARHGRTLDMLQKKRHTDADSTQLTEERW